MPDTLNEAMDLAGTTSIAQEIQIDNDLRTVVIPSGLVLGVYNDKKTHRVHFRMQKEYSGIDLSTFAFRINYQNAAGEGDVYEVTDNAVDGDDITFSWFVGRFAYVQQGDVRFSVCLRKTDGEGRVEQEFNTEIATLQVLEGYEPDDASAETISDVYAMMHTTEDRATEAATSASKAATSETNAASSASSASSNAGKAATSESNAAKSASAASTSASSASSSATKASTSESNASKSATAASTSATNAATSASKAATSETNAASSATKAASSATAAATSATNAANSVATLAPVISMPHNNIYRGKNLGTAVTDAQINAIKNGTFDDLYIGDYWTIGSITYRIADFDYWFNKGDTAFTKHHAVIVNDPIWVDGWHGTMNATNTTDGAYVGSRMYTEQIPTVVSAIESAFGAAHVLSHREHLQNATANGASSGGTWYDVKAVLMNEPMVYGHYVFEGLGAPAGTIINRYTIDNHQFALFRLNSSMINKNRAWYWLRDVVSATDFARVSSSGYSGYPYASDDGAVRVAFPLGA